MRMKTNHTKVEGLFSVDICRDVQNGQVYIIDTQRNEYEVRTKDGQPLSEEQFNEIWQKGYGYWSIVKRYQVIVCPKGDQ